MQKKSDTGSVTGQDLIEKRLHSPAVSLLVGLSIVGAIVYLSYLTKPEYRGDTLPYTMVIVAEVFLIMQGMLSFWTIMNGKFNPRTFEYHNAQDLLFGKRRAKTMIKDLSHMSKQESRELDLYVEYKRKSVDVFIPVYGEPVEEIRQTAIAARDMYGKHETYILDDGESDEVRDMARKLKVGYIRRPVHDHAKAGNINYALSKTKGALFAIIDADFVAKPEFLYEVVPFFEDRTLAFVQTPQYYGNDNNFVSIAAGYMQHVFYSMVMAGKNRFNAAFCVGTNVMFRRSAIKDIGGIYEGSKSEDIWTAMMLHERGWRSVYINRVLAVGKTPETFKAYAKQQLRWATGSFEIFLKRNPLFNTKLSVDQRLQYFATTIFYFNGFAVLSLLLLPPLQIYFNITPIALGIPLWQWALLYSSFYALQLMLSLCDGRPEVANRRYLGGVLSDLRESVFQRTI